MDSNLINTSTCRWVTNSTGMTDCGSYRNSTTKYLLKGKIVQSHPNALTNFGSLAVTIRFQAASAAQVYLNRRNFVRSLVFILQMSVVCLQRCLKIFTCLEIQEEKFCSVVWKDHLEMLETLLSVCITRGKKVWKRKVCWLVVSASFFFSFSSEVNQLASC